MKKRGEAMLCDQCLRVMYHTDGRGLLHVEGHWPTAPIVVTICEMRVYLCDSACVVEHVNSMIRNGFMKGSGYPIW
jgi:hypothetical protein